jgi:hypothetical protein
VLLSQDRWSLYYQDTKCICNNTVLTKGLQQQVQKKETTYLSLPQKSAKLLQHNNNEKHPTTNRALILIRQVDDIQKPSLDTVQMEKIATNQLPVLLISRTYLVRTDIALTVTHYRSRRDTSE